MANPSHECSEWLWGWCPLSVWYYRERVSYMPLWRGLYNGVEEIHSM